MSTKKEETIYKVQNSQGLPIKVTEMHYLALEKICYECEGMDEKSIVNTVTNWINNLQYQVHECDDVEEAESLVELIKALAWAVEKYKSGWTIESSTNTIGPFERHIRGALVDIGDMFDIVGGWFHGASAKQSQPKKEDVIGNILKRKP